MRNTLRGIGFLFAFGVMVPAALATAPVNDNWANATVIAGLSPSEKREKVGANPYSEKRTMPPVLDSASIR